MKHTMKIKHIVFALVLLLEMNAAAQDQQYTQFFSF